MTKLNSSFMIDVEIPHRTVLAPMAGVTICLSYHCQGIWCWSCGDGDDF